MMAKAGNEVDTSERLLKNSLFEAMNSDREICGRNSSVPVLFIKFQLAKLELSNIPEMQGDM